MRVVPERSSITTLRRVRAHLKTIKTLKFPKQKYIDINLWCRNYFLETFFIFFYVKTWNFFPKDYKKKKKFFTWFQKEKNSKLGNVDFAQPLCNMWVLIDFMMHAYFYIVISEFSDRRSGNTSTLNIELFLSVVLTVL